MIYPINTHLAENNIVDKLVRMSNNPYVFL